MIKFIYKDSCIRLEGHANNSENCSAFSFMISYIMNNTGAGLSDRSDSVSGLAVIDCRMLSIHDLSLVYNMLEFYNDHVEKIENLRKELKDE